jgi:hypothetical protein
MRHSSLLLTLFVVGLSGCAASPTVTAGARGPTPPQGSYLPPPVLPRSPVTEPDPVQEAAARTRVLAIGDEWPMVVAWDGTPPVDRGDGVLRVRPAEEACAPRRWRGERWSSACVVPANPGWRPGRQQRGHRGWRGARGW